MRRWTQCFAKGSAARLGWLDRRTARRTGNLLNRGVVGFAAGSPEEFRRCPLNSNFCERLRQVVQNVVDVFDAD